MLYSWMLTTKRCKSKLLTVKQKWTYPQLPLYSNLPWFSCIARSGVWKFSATIWQPVFQKIWNRTCSQAQHSISHCEHGWLWTSANWNQGSLYFTEPGPHEKFSRTCSSSRMFKNKQKLALLRYSECSPLQKNSARSKMWTLAVQNSDELTVCSEKTPTHRQR